MKSKTYIFIIFPEILYKIISQINNDLGIEKLIQISLYKRTIDEIENLYFDTCS